MIEDSSGSREPETFNSLRALCETEWVGRYPARYVASWIGHSAAVAAKHYLMTSDVYMDPAAGMPEVAADEGAEKTAQNPAQYLPETAWNAFPRPFRGK